MSDEYRSDVAFSLTFVPPERWATVTGLVLKPDGTTLEAPVPTVSTVATTVATSASNTADQFLLTSPTGVVRGLTLEIVSAVFGTELRKVQSISGSTVTLTEPLPGIPAAASTVKGVDITMAVSAITTRAINYQAIVRPSTGQGEVRQMFHVVYHPFEDPVSTSMVTRYLRGWVQNHPWLNNPQTIEDIAEDANDRIRTRIERTGDYPHRFWDPTAYREAAAHAVMLVLCERGLVPPGVDDVTIHKRDLGHDLQAAIGAAALSSTAIDRDDSGVIEASEEGPWDIQVYR